MSKYPRVLITEEGMRDGLQIESLSITTDQKLQLLNALTDAGLTRIVVGSFVHPKWTPQMADTDALIERLVPSRSDLPGPGAERQGPRAAQGLVTAADRRRDAPDPPAPVWDLPQAQHQPHAGGAGEVLGPGGRPLEGGGHHRGGHGPERRLGLQLPGARSPSSSASTHYRNSTTAGPRPASRSR